MSRRRLLLCATLAATLPVAGCTADTPTPPPDPTRTFSASDLRLVAYDSCDDLTKELRAAAKQAVGPWGLGDNVQYFAEGDMAGGARSMADSAPAAAAKEAQPQAFSGTNIHEQGSDEPDIVKTDGRRIITMIGTDLVVVDPVTRAESGRLRITKDWAEADLLLSGDRAMVLLRGGENEGPATSRKRPYHQPQEQTRVVLVDLTGAPREISRFTTDGSLVDARMTGSTVRVVTRNSPRIAFPEPGGRFFGSSDSSDEEDQVADNRKAIDKAPATDWLPEWSVTSGGDTRKGTVDCTAVSRPPSFSGTSMATVFTFDAAGPDLGDGQPVTVAADGDTVYATPTSLYIASDTRWWQNSWFLRSRPVQEKTEIYRFDLPAVGKPVYTNAASVPGWLVNQYALSEWDGRLRVATTTDGSSSNKSSSAVRVLEQDGDRLKEVGIVDGLGKGERIYSARFIGDRGYLVTFRRTDPLYTLDLSNPRSPEVTGELKITGYSAHLQPVGENRLIGIGQEADENGRTQGTQVSLFDVSDPAAPRRLAQHHVSNAQSEAEYDPHAILWWPGTNLLVLPMYRYEPVGGDSETGALALRVTDQKVDPVGELKQSPNRDGYAPQIRRNLVVGDTLWSLTDTELRASSLSTLEPLGAVRIN